MVDRCIKGRRNGICVLNTDAFWNVLALVESQVKGLASKVGENEGQPRSLTGSARAALHVLVVLAGDSGHVQEDVSLEVSLSNAQTHWPLKHIGRNLNGFPEKVSQVVDSKLVVNLEPVKLVL